MKVYKSNIDVITDLLFIDSYVEKVDVAIILGNDWEKTMDDLFPYYEAGLIPKMIITGHSANSDREPEPLRFKRRGLELGIIDDDIFLESKATNTKENF